MKAKIGCVFAVLCLLLGPVAGRAQPEYPASPIRLIIPFSAGGAPDIIGRILAEKASKGLGQDVVVENRTGAGGNIGFALGAKAAPDGYTLLMCTFGCATNPFLYKKISWSPSEFAPVMLAGMVPNVLVVRPTLNVDSVEQFIALGRSKPGSLTMASSGVGSASHLAGERFNDLAKIEALHVPYKGSSAALPDIAGGRVDYMIVSVPEAMPYLADKRLKALGVSTEVRATSLPDVPTIQEAGLPGYSVAAWSMLVAPSGTPAQVIERLNTEFNKAVSDSEVVKRLKGLSVLPGGGTSHDAQSFLEEQARQWKPLIERKKISAD